MSMLERRSALEAYWQKSASGQDAPAPGAAARVTLSERRPLSILQISCFAATIQDAGARLADALLLDVPTANRCHGDARLGLRSSGPGVWQLVGEPNAVPLAADLRLALAGVATLVDLTHARTAFELSGVAAADTLRKHCGVDLDSTRFPSGSSIATRFGAIAMNLSRLNDAPVFELLVSRSYAEYALELLLGAGAEFGLRIQPCT